MSGAFPPGCWTTTSTWPAPAGVVTLIVVAFTTLNAVPAVPPNVTPVAPVKPVPVMTTAVPPAAAPVVTSRLAIVGV